jgi:hypothetical protein
MRDPGIAQHDFHQLRGPVGRGRHGGIILAHRHALWIAVNRRGRGEDEIAHPRFDRGLDQGAGVDRVVAVVAERIANRVWHDDRGCEMDYGVDPMRGNERAHARLVSGIADDERRARRHRTVEAGGQIIEHHGLLSGLEEGVNHVAADVAGAAGDQDRHVASRFRAITIVRLPRRKIRWNDYRS